MRKWMIFLCFCFLLSGCANKGTKKEASAKIIDERGENAEEMEEGGSEETVEEAPGEMKENFLDNPDNLDNLEKIILSLEKFESGLEFSYMDGGLAESYGEPLKDSYDFVGRMTADGIGYVIGLKKGESSLLDGLSIYGKDDYIEAAVWSEQEEEYKPVYTFKNINSLLQGGSKSQILYLQPINMAAPEEIEDAFFYQYCDGLQGVEYAEDVFDRGVRFTPPDTGAYLFVNRYENGIQRVEYVALTKEEETEILESDEMILPELYGENGLEFFVSQETYEKMEVEEGAITMPALKIAEERCRFQVTDISEIHDIVKAEMRFYGKREGDEKGITLLFAMDLMDETQLSELSALLSDAEPVQEGKCPYGGVITLRRGDETEITVSLAADGCSGFIVGSHGTYSLTKEAMERVWEMFTEPRFEKYMPWDGSDKKTGKSYGPGEG